MGEAKFTPPSETGQAPTPPGPQRISSHIMLQTPLSRRGRGPGLVLVLDHYSEIQPSEKHLDPPPLQKWAEEGFAVVQVCWFQTKKEKKTDRGCWDVGVG